MNHMLKIKLGILVLVFTATGNLQAQDLLSILDNETTDSQYVPATFKMTRIAFGHSTEVRPKNVLEVFVANRFWNLPQNASQSFVADRMSSRFALEYSLSDRLTFGLGASTFDHLFDGFFKYRLVLQKRGGKGWPVNVTLFQNASYDSSAIPNLSIADGFSDRMSFTTQVLISRRFSKNFSFQLSPSVVNRSLGLSDDDPTSLLALGARSRYPLCGHVSFAT